MTKSTRRAHPGFFFHPLRLALLAVVAGYGLDMFLSQKVLVEAGLDPSVAVQLLPTPDDPQSKMASLSYLLILGGHALAFFGALLELLGNPEAWRGRLDGRARFAIAVAVWGLTGLGLLLSEPRHAGIHSLTYVDVILMDVLVVAAIVAAVWMRPGQEHRLQTRQRLGLLLAVAIAAGLSSLAVTAGAPWMVVIAIVSTLCGLHFTHQLLVDFTAPEKPPSEDRVGQLDSGPTL